MNSNFQQMSKVGGPLKDTTFQVDSLYKLTEDLISLQDFPLEGYRKNGLQKHGNLAVYASQNLREYIFEGRGNLNDEGVVIKLIYAGDKADVSGKSDTLTYFFHGKDISDHMKEEINKYLTDIATRGTAKGRRNKRSFMDKLKP